MSAVYHAGERAVQDRAGVAEIAARNGRGIHSSLPDAARPFLAEQTFVVAGWTDPQQRVWCTLLGGRSGFLHAPDEWTVAIEATPATDDPIAGLADDDQIGLLAIDPATRRRMRVNGTATRTDLGLRVAVDQVFSNCPKYITTRLPVGTRVGASQPESTMATSLSDDDRSFITTADAFFLATALPDRGPADASHRGGNPGFVEVPDATTIVWPDYPGNSMFQSLGNLDVNPRAGLLFVDWSTFDVLHVTGAAETDWNAAKLEPRAERLVRFRVEGVLWRRAVAPASWQFVELSKFNPPLV